MPSVTQEAYELLYGSIAFMALLLVWMQWPNPPARVMAPGRRCRSSTQQRSSSQLHSSTPIHQTPQPNATLIYQALPFHLHGSTRDGRVVLYVQQANCTLTPHLTDRDYLLYWQLVFGFLSTLVGPGVMVVMDLHNVTRAQLVGPAIRHCGRQLSQVVAQDYPTLVTNVCFINTPKWFGTVLPLLKLSARGYPVQLQSSREFFDVLISSIGRDELPPEYEGWSKYRLGQHPMDHHLGTVIRLATERADRQVPELRASSSSESSVSTHETVKPKRRWGKKIQAGLTLQPIRRYIRRKRQTS